MRRLFLTFLAFASASPFAAQTLNVDHAQTESRTVKGDGAEFLRDFARGEQGPLWGAYSVKTRQMAENDCWGNGVQNLEDNGHGYTYGAKRNGKVHLEGSESFLVLFRVENRRVGRIRTVPVDCPIDAGGLRFVSISGVSADGSIAFLLPYASADRDGDNPNPQAAMSAIALHASEGADVALEGLAKPPHPESVREHALFWLASARGHRGYVAVRDAAEHDGNVDIREKAMFDLSISKDPEAENALIHFAHYAPEPRVRAQAIFWIAQKAGKLAAATLTGAVTEDPDVEVKKKAVFGLQQLPPDQGIPLLIKVASTNGSPEVRKQAIFWLGQSHDPRALTFLEKLIKGGKG